MNQIRDAQSGINDDEHSFFAGRIFIGKFPEPAGIKPKHKAANYHYKIHQNNIQS